MQKDKKYIRIIFSLGSNFEQQANMNHAKELLCTFFKDIRFSPLVWTKPIGFVSDRFLNGLASALSPYTMEQTVEVLKNIELACGSCDWEKKNNLIRMDLDLLQYSQDLFHIDDWERAYIKNLIKDIL